MSKDLKFNTFEAEFSDKMLISEYKIQFLEKMGNLYAPSEALSLFYLVLHEISGATKTDELLEKEINNSVAMDNVLSELISGKPVQYILGYTYFSDLKIKTNKSALIPRPETEELVEWVVEENQNFTGSILDVGTGTGCIALALKHQLPYIKISGIDISENALELANSNALYLGIEINFSHCDILLTEPNQRYDIIVSNPPYIGIEEKSSLDKRVLDFEPHEALFAYEDELMFYKRLALISKKWNCIIYAETSEFYIDALNNWLQENLFIFEFRKDIFGKTRFVKINPHQ